MLSVELSVREALRVEEHGCLFSTDSGRHDISFECVAGEEKIATLEEAEKFGEGVSREFPSPGTFPPEKLNSTSE